LSNGDHQISGMREGSAVRLGVVRRNGNSLVRLVSIPMGHHFSTELARSYPPLDLTDVYAFESDLPGKTCLVLIANPKSKADSRDNLSADAIYKFHLGADKLHNNGPTYTVRFRPGVMAVGLLDQPQDSLGLTGNLLGETPLNQVAELPTGLRCWAGTVRDPFFGNQNGLRELREAFAKGDLTWTLSSDIPANHPLLGLYRRPSCWRFRTICCRPPSTTSLQLSGMITGIGTRRIA
jgi:hypothetical protein